MRTFMYVFCLLVWGLNFIAVKIQGTPVSLEVSLTYRLLGAACLFVLFAFLTRPEGFPVKKDMFTIVTFGICNFALSYLFLYYGTIWSNAALVTLIFSLKTVLTPISLRVFLKEKLEPRILVGGMIGLMGVGVMVYPILVHDFSLNYIKGIGIALLGTLLTSIGDASSARNAKHHIHPVYSNSIGGIVAALFLLVLSIMQGETFAFPTSISYVSALLYLTVIASFAAWMFYLNLVKQIGASLSSYMVALFPAVGGVASVLIGESELTIFLVGGCLLGCMGAAVALNFFHKIAEPWRKKRVMQGNI
ncbi:DMT family transporter [Bacillus sp. KH172YL63]|uniref:DMT family transporter n=1 Tax=Bacillus sp. KH172YL63 TaxID=2709784 RepID=UPI0013E43CF8|nr:DMT family transporter [Bacillus sp. KH172YL63]BCB04047.1 O-acetylserine/cysteine exporter [Bacillus sp. KH172YL63]